MTYQSMNSPRHVIAVFVLASVVGGCASAPPRPQLVAGYVEPDNSASDLATVTGTFTQRLMDAYRIRLEGIDGAGVPPGPRVPVPIRLKSGTRQLALLCETSLSTGSAWITLAVDIKAGHSYVLRCEQQSVLLNLGTDFKVEDQSDSNRIVASGSSWGPSSPPRGRAF